MTKTTETPGGAAAAPQTDDWPLLRLSDDGRVSGPGECWTAITGTDPTKVADPWFVVHVHDRQRLRDEITAAIAEGRALQTRARLRRADAVYRDVPLAMRRVGDGEGWILSSPEPLGSAGPAPRDALAESAGSGGRTSRGPTALHALFHRLSRQHALDRRHGRYSAFVTLGPIPWNEVGDDRGAGLVKRLSRLLRRSDLIVAPVDGPTVLLITDLGSDLDGAAVNAGDIAAKVARWLGEHLGGAAPLAAAVVMLGQSDAWPEALERAESQRCRALEAGESVVFGDPALQRAAVERDRLIAALREAIEGRSFVLQYQPMLGRGNALVGVEALLRWHRRDAGGLLFPGEFIPVAERAGLMQPLGRWVLESVCERHRQWRSQLGRDVTLAVNVGEAEFRAPDFAEHACALFERAGLASGAVVLELPGPVFGDPDQRALTTIGRLRSAGFGIAFDGFGARHLDLLALRELPVDAIKLHSHDVLDRLGAGVGRAVVDAVVGVAHSLGLEVQAKSIETSEQLAVFREGGCDVFQGRLIGEPSASPRALRRVGMVVH